MRALFQRLQKVHAFCFFFLLPARFKIDDAYEVLKIGTPIRTEEECHIMSYNSLCSIFSLLKCLYNIVISAYDHFLHICFLLLLLRHAFCLYADTMMFTRLIDLFTNEKHDADDVADDLLFHCRRAPAEMSRFCHVVCRRCLERQRFRPRPACRSIIEFDVTLPSKIQRNTYSFFCHAHMIPIIAQRR